VAVRPLVVIPTYNERQNLPELIPAVLEQLPSAELLFVDDASPDGTADAVEALTKQEPRLHLVRRSGKLGLGTAYVEGFRWGLARNHDALVQMDADLSHDPRDLPRLVGALDHADVAVGCRYTTGGGTTGWGRLREGISRGGNCYARAVLGLRYRDLTGGFNAWKREVLERIDLGTVRSIGYAFQIELKFRAHRLGFRIDEVPIHFHERAAGQSKMTGAIVREAAFRVLQLRWKNDESR
jgi:dolichol-phosphate mannosyltransferase